MDRYLCSFHFKMELLLLISGFCSSNRVYQMFEEEVEKPEQYLQASQVQGPRNGTLKRKRCVSYFLGLNSKCSLPFYSSVAFLWRILCVYFKSFTFHISMWKKTIQRMCPGRLQQTSAALSKIIITQSQVERK